MLALVLVPVRLRDPTLFPQLPGHELLSQVIFSATESKAPGCFTPRLVGRSHIDDDIPRNGASDVAICSSFCAVPNFFCL